MAANDYEIDLHYAAMQVYAAIRDATGLRPLGPKDMLATIKKLTPYLHELAQGYPAAFERGKWPGWTTVNELRREVMEAANLVEVLTGVAPPAPAPGSRYSISCPHGYHASDTHRDGAMSTITSLCRVCRCNKR